MISSYSRSLELIRPMDLSQDAAQLQKIPAEQLRNEVGVFAKPFELLLDQIQRYYGQFALPDSRNADPKQVLQKAMSQYVVDLENLAASLSK